MNTIWCLVTALYFPLHLNSFCGKFVQRGKWPLALEVGAPILIFRG